MITVLAIERGVLGTYGRPGGWMATLGLSTVASGANPDLAGPIAEGLAHAGVATADVAQAADADLAGVPDTRYTELVDRAIEAALEMMAATCSQVSTTSLDLTIQWNDLAARIQKALDAKAVENLRRYGPGAATRPGMLATGSFKLPSTFDPPRDDRWPPRQGFLGGPR